MKEKRETYTREREREGGGGGAITSSQWFSFLYYYFYNLMNGKIYSSDPEEILATATNRASSNYTKFSFSIFLYINRSWKK